MRSTDTGIFRKLSGLLRSSEKEGDDHQPVFEIYVGTPLRIVLWSERKGTQMALKRRDLTRLDVTGKDKP